MKQTVEKNTRNKTGEYHARTFQSTERHTHLEIAEEQSYNMDFRIAIPTVVSPVETEKLGKNEFQIDK
jgi:hypothetical protein